MNRAGQLRGLAMCRCHAAALLVMKGGMPLPKQSAREVSVSILRQWPGPEMSSLWMVRQQRRA